MYKNIDNTFNILTSIYKFSKIFQTDDLYTINENIIAKVINQINNLYNFDYSIFIPFDNDKKLFYIKGSKISYNNFNKVYLSGNYFLDKIIKTKKIIINNFLQDSKYNGLYLTSPKSLLILPLFITNSFFGVLYFEANEPKNFTSNDLALLNIISSQTSFYYQNFSLVKKLEDNFLSTIKTLVATIEVKDHYTKGHSQRVMEYSITFGALLNLDSKTIKTLGYAALLHDIGKIGIPENILNKTSKLNDKEFTYIKKHPEFGEQMLLPLDFFEKERKIIRWHHERWNGEGYPDKLLKNQIPFDDRIISLADTLDAMSTNRPYRKPLTFNQIIKELEKGIGSQFDPDLGKLFINYLKNFKIKILTKA